MNKLSLFAFLLLLCAPLSLTQTTVLPKTAVLQHTMVIAGGAVTPTIAFDAVSNATPITSGNSISWTHTVTGSNTVLIVGIGGDINAATPACTYNGVSMTKLWSGQDSATVYSSYVAILVNPATGSHTVSCTTIGTVSTAGGAATSWTGVNQSTPNRTVFSAQDTASPPPSIVCSNAVSGDEVVDFLSVFGASSTVATAQTSRYIGKNLSATTLNLFMSSANATGSTTMSYTGTPSAFWYYGCVALIP